MGATQKTTKVKGFFSRLTAALKHYPYGVLALAIPVGLVSIPLVDETDAIFSSNKFCTSCHIMDSTVYQELQLSKHWTTHTGVRPGCADCHVSDRLVPAMWDHFIGTHDLLSFIGGVRDKPEFEKVRAEAADRVRMKMLADGNATCKKCHTPAAIVPRKKRGRTQHKDMVERNIPCIVCHYDLVHKEVETSEQFTKASDQYFD